MRRVAAVKYVITAISAVVLIACLYCTPLFGNKPVLIVSGSMEPTIHTNALTVLHMCKLEDVEIGDIVTYYHPYLKVLVTHRVIEKDALSALTQGDANAAADNVRVTDENIYGKQILIINWVAPILTAYSSGEYSRADLTSAMIVLFGAVCLAYFALSFAVTYGIAAYKAITNSPYDQDDANELVDVVTELADRAAMAYELNAWQRFKLYLAYRLCQNFMLDVKDKLTHL